MTIPLSFFLLQKDTKAIYTHVLSILCQELSLLPLTNNTQKSHTVRNCDINAILIWPLNNDMYKYLASFAFDFGYSFPSLNGLTPMSTHSGFLYQPATDPGMISTQHDPICHPVYLIRIHNLVFQESKVCALNFALKANPRPASNLKSFVIRIPCCVLLDVVPRSQTQQNGAHYRGCKPLSYSVPCTFSGPSPFFSEVPEQPKVSSPPLKEDITHSPSTLMVMVLSPGPVWGPLSAFYLNYEQACNTVRSLLHTGTVAMHTIPCLCPGYDSEDLYSFLLDFGLPLL
ncbi:hypothetical protein DSO57_1000228 [Entomophthora muscae]|uniref:Uncharacterized protein n=1 Tax=Entomophthora muscae TaxID=34485 RepID=A0ACC2U7C7_9FUNG|nr:hypothetical protein DSO57_1000228 [Entomophthora muscae]